MTMKKLIAENIADHQRIIDAMLNDGVDTIANIAQAIGASLKAGGKVLIAGNGGSAADAQHIAGEFVGRFQYDRRPLSAMALSTDTSIITCIGNDYSFDDIFVRQVEALGNDGDVFWAFSTSGDSVNIVRAAQQAKKLNLVVVGFTGHEGGKLAQIADICLKAPADRTDRVQEAHTLAYHCICQLVEVELCPK